MTRPVRCLIYTRISKDKLGDGHGVANQLTDLEKRAAARGWAVTHRLSDNDIGVTRKDPTKAGKYRPGYEEVLRLVDASAVDVVLLEVGPVYPRAAGPGVPDSPLRPGWGTVRRGRGNHRPGH